MNRYFDIEVTRCGFEVVDLQPLFRERYALNGVRLEFTDDAHWNAHGHLTAGLVIANSSTFRSLFGTLAVPPLTLAATSCVN